MRACSGSTAPETMQLVSGCPCSAATKRGTHAWRLAQFKAVQHATERPMNTPCALLLRALADTGPGETVDDPEGSLGLLKAYGYAVDSAEGGPVVTDLGRRYLRAREELRWRAWGEVVSVDLTARTATAVVSGFNAGGAVTVLLDLLLAGTGLDVVRLTGTRLEAEANCHAETADDLVLTKIRVVEPLRDGAPERGVPRAE
ncbi:hypothetical protein [Streptomyces sp. NPDC056291]|uniref:hypothetical protein n=1 Tax=Streptomyces sp. NPDC056291 TaxID=3345772 RepID=UPI0035E12DAB